MAPSNTRATTGDIVSTGTSLARLYPVDPIHPESSTATDEAMFPAGEPQPFLDSGGYTDPGRVRDSNDDGFLVADLARSLVLGPSSTNLEEGTTWFEAPQGKLMVVADGITAAGASELASRVALEKLAEHVTGHMPWRAGGDDEIERELSAAMLACQDAIRRAALDAGLDRAPIGASLTIGYIDWPHVHIAHAGDCRAYVIRDGHIERLTGDDTLGQRLVEREIVDPDDAGRWDDVVVNAVGGPGDELDIELHRRELAMGDQLLLCSDGVSRYLDDLEIASIVAEAITAATACRRLVEEAVRRGGEDNATAVLTRAEPQVDTSPVTFS